MKRVAAAVLCMFTASCASPSYQFLKGGERVEQPGVSFVLPAQHKWAAIIRTTYQGAFGALGMPRNDTLIVAYTVFNVKPFATKQEFLNIVREGRAAEPQTGRFETIRSVEELYSDRSEICVMYRSASKDFGVEAKRGGEYSVFEEIGMYCAHPKNPKVGIQVEITRKAPPGAAYPTLEADALTLLRSVQFGEF
jgi:hypothetical protein